MIPANAVPQLNSKDILSSPHSGPGDARISPESAPGFQSRLEEAVQSGGAPLPGEIPGKADEIEKSLEDSSKEVKEELVARQGAHSPGDLWLAKDPILQQPAQQQSKSTERFPQAVANGMARVSGQDSNPGLTSPGMSKFVADPMDARGVNPIASAAKGIDLESGAEEGFEALEGTAVVDGIAMRDTQGIERTEAGMERILSNPSLKVEYVRESSVSDLVAPGGERTSKNVSPVATEDFLSLRELRKGKGSQGSLVQGSMDPLSQGGLSRFHAGPVIEAPVTREASGKTILSLDSVHRISEQVNLLGKARQDGEIKIRLKPDHLGELVMNVKSRGNEVSIQIKTHDLEAKKIIEESIGRLKDSLSMQNLSLSKVDVVAQANPVPVADQSMQMDFSQNQGFFQRGDSQGQGDAGRGARQEFLYDESPRAGTLNTIGAVRSGRTSGTGTLDLIA